MSATPRNTIATVVPCLCYRDAHAAIDWLCEVFGFAQNLVVEGENGTVAHAQLSFGNGMIMLGSVRTDYAYGALLAQPDEIVGRQTQTIYLTVSNADAVHERAMRAGAAIIIALADGMAGADLPAAIPAGTSGALAPTIRGKALGNSLC